MAQIRVADISRWQGLIDWDTFKENIDGVIIKATGSDGGNYTDSLLQRNRDEARRVNVPRWYYHYKGSGSAADQAVYMLNAIGGLQLNEAIVLDDENEAKVNPEFCAEFADKIKELTGINIVVYSNQSRFSGVDLSSLKSRNLGAWVAKYGQNGGDLESAGSAPSISGMDIIMWQYTSTARILGVSDNSVDMNIFYGDVEQFKSYGTKNNFPAPAPAPEPTPQPEPQTSDGTYTVVSGDTLSGIGQKVGVDWQVIASTNGIVSPYTIYPGQVLKVYGGSAGQSNSVISGVYTVVSGDTLSGIGVKTGHNWQDIASLNGIDSPYTIYPGQRLNLPGGSVSQEETYTVISGDSLSAIGQKTGKDWQDIASLNNINPPYTIYPNQVLRLP